ncbi:unnamed protein product [Rotaria sp. Silwood2]|nr:unnamed protein product [Rotaria sp. Silwood2]CAF3464394.1 unnamed protein product [Rotaria sp. Silwood2]CAF4516575.1 unnamed protein product [Rotaria sp. Silwood2]CAF4628911.1 unnamed protein product [Rotaria sp. Silwood2]
MKYKNDIQDEKIFFILSGELSKETAKEIDYLSQVSSIYVFDLINTNNEHSIQQSKKYKGIFTQIETICNKVKEDIIQYEHEIVQFDYVSANFNSNSIKSDKNNQEPNFMFAQLIKDIITNVEYSQRDYEDMINYLRSQYSDNNNILRIIDEFQSENKPKKFIFWYTKDSIFYKIINKGLCT